MILCCLISDEQVNIAVMPESATFPELDKTQEYGCHFTAINYSFTLPFVGGQFCDASTTVIPHFDLVQIGKLSTNIHFKLDSIFDLVQIGKLSTNIHFKLDSICLQSSVHLN